MGDAQALLPIGLPLCEDLQGDLVTVESPGRTGRTHERLPHGPVAIMSDDLIDAYLHWRESARAVTDA
jgi:hypothetical protein